MGGFESGHLVWGEDGVGAGEDAGLETAFGLEGLFEVVAVLESGHGRGEALVAWFEWGRGDFQAFFLHDFEEGGGLGVIEGETSGGEGSLVLADGHAVAGGAFVFGEFGGFFWAEEGLELGVDFGDFGGRGVVGSGGGVLSFGEEIENLGGEFWGKV